jgi:acetyl-CoA carboxylase biotin carboxyl carrier protein
LDARRDDRTGSSTEKASERQPLEAVLLTSGVIEAVRSLVEIMDQGGITRLDLVHGDLSIRLQGGERAVATAPANATALVDEALPSVPAGLVEVAPATSEPGEYVVTSPMVGTYYTAPSPNAPPFVRVGDMVETGQTVGIVEAMKIMNEIVAERGGIVTAMLVDNGQAVEYGSPLIRLGARPAPGGPA